MKKTIIALLALAGVSAASDTTQLLDKTWTWDAGDKMSISKVDGSNQLTYKGSDWGVNAIKLNLGSDAITLSQNQILTLNVTHNANSSDNSFTIALESKGVALVGGRSFSGTYRVGVSNEIGMSRGYVFSGSNNEKETANITAEYTADQGSDVTAYYKNLTDSSFTSNTTVDGKIVINPNSFTLTVLYDKEQKGFIGTMNMGDISESIFLGGDTFTVNNVVATFVTNNTAQVTDLSLSIKTLPEPTTATLSLLALAGLVARRRRK